VACDIYSAGEANLGEINGQQVADLIAKEGREVEFQSSLESVSKFLTENLQPGDLALFLGAGNLNQIIPEVMAFYQQADRPD
jgi:UDP-N-acetylmuramate--alanine ligase